MRFPEAVTSRAGDSARFASETQDGCMVSGEEPAHGARFELHPFDIRFTHDSVSAAFRTGVPLDDEIEQVLGGRLGPKAFPPLEITLLDGHLYSISNRRLFLFRVLASFGLRQQVQVEYLAPGCERLRHLRWDDRLGRMAPKFKRSHTTRNMGSTMQVRSKYVDFQF